MATFEEMEKEFGSVEYKGIEYILIEQAYPSNRLFDNCWSNAEHGEEYTSEWQARAVNESGDYMVVWQWDEIKGEELEDASNYPVDNDHIARVIEQ